MIFDRQLLRFALVGGSNGAVTVVVYALLITIGLGYALAAVLGYLAGLVNGYTWNRIWTFESGPFHLIEFARYVVVQGSGLLVNLALLFFLVDGLGLSRITGEVISIIPVVLLTFSINREWTFRPRGGTPPGRA